MVESLNVRTSGELPLKETTPLLTTLARPLSTLDDASLQLRLSAQDWSDSIKRNDSDGIAGGCLNQLYQWVSCFSSCFSVCKGPADLAKLMIQHSSLISHLFSYTNIVLHLCNAYLHSSISEDIRYLIPKHLVVATSVVLNVVGVIFYSVCLSRDEKVLSAFKALTMGEKINALRKCDSVYFRLFLPLDVRREIRKHSVDEYRDQAFYADLQAANTVTAEPFLNRIERFVGRRAITQKAAVLASLAGVGSGLLSLLHELSTLGTLLSLANTVAFLLVFLSKGWVENPKPGYNPKLFLPEFCQKEQRLSSIIPVQEENLTELS